MPEEQLKKLEKKLETPISGVHSQMLVLHESTGDDIRIVAEGVAALGARMERGFKVLRKGRPS